MRGRPRLRLFSLVVLALVVLTASLSPVALAACSSGSAEEDGPTAIATQTVVATAISESSPSPTATATPTEEPTPTVAPTPRPRTISTVFEPAEAGSAQIVVDGAPEYVTGARFTLNFGTNTEEEIFVAEAKFQLRPGRGIYVLTLEPPLKYAHRIGESVSEIPKDIPVLTPSEPQVPENVTFVFDPATPVDDQRAIRLGVEYASRTFAESFGRPAGPITLQTVTEGCKGVVATYISATTICFNINHPDWKGSTFELKLKIGAHEYFHNLQSTIGCSVGWNTSGSDAVWLGEGSAEYYGLLVLSQTELVGLDGIIAQLRSGIKTRNAGKLSEMESPPPPYGLDYALATVAMSYLVERSSISAYVGYCTARAQGEEWHSAFAGAFGLSVDEFYKEFEAYRANDYK